MAVKALCSTKGGSNCTGLNYKWTVQIPSINETEITRIMDDDNYALGCDAGECAQDLAIFTTILKMIMIMAEHVARSHANHYQNTSQ